MKAETTSNPAPAQQQGTRDEVSRREFLMRLRKKAIYAAPAVAAVFLTPGKAFGS